MMNAARPRRLAISLVELLVVLAIIAVLIGLLLPAIQRVRERARQTACMSNMKSLGIALLEYESTHGQLPLGTSPGNKSNWLVELYPYLEQGQLYQHVLNDTELPTGQTASAQALTVLQCPSDGLGGRVSTLGAKNYSHSNYLAFFGTYMYGEAFPSAAFGWDYGARMAEITDGTSNTMMVGEYLTGVANDTAPQDLRGVYWLEYAGSNSLFAAKPPNSSSPDSLKQGHCWNDRKLNLPCTTHEDSDRLSAGARSRHRQGVNSLFADGSVRFVADNIETITWTHMASRDDAHRQHFMRDRYLVSTHGKPDGVVGAIEQAGGKVLQTYDNFDVVAVQLPREAVERVTRLPGVKKFERDPIVYGTAQISPTGVRRIEADPITISGNYSDVVVAVIDSGIDANHEDLNVVFNRAFGALPNPDDEYGHGTHVAGIIGAKNNNVGVVGVAPNASLWNLRVLDSNNAGTGADVLAAMNFAIRHAGEIKVCNMSLGAPYDPADPEDLAIRQAVRTMTDAGIVVVVAAGNDGLNETSALGLARTAINVGALCDTNGLPGGGGPLGPFNDPDDTYASYSNYGDFIAVVAPGSSIASCMPGNQYAVASGTSQAAPHVAGLVAVMLSSSSPLQPFPPTPGTPGTPGTPSQLVLANIPTNRNLLITTFIPGKPATPPTPGGSS
ncbi:MAG: S8 family serine peptidase, partial [Gemmataceae bacterium]